MASGQSGSSPAVAHGNRWATAVASLAVGGASFALCFTGQHLAAADFRRMRAKLGTAQAITATAHKIARILYHVLSTKEPYVETVFHRYVIQH